MGYRMELRHELPAWVPAWAFPVLWTLVPKPVSCPRIQQEESTGIGSHYACGGWAGGGADHLVIIRGAALHKLMDAESEKYAGIPSIAAGVHAMLREILTRSSVSINAQSGLKAGSGDLTLTQQHLAGLQDAHRQLKEW